MSLAALMGNSIDHTDFYGAMVPQYGYENKKSTAL